MDNFQELLAVNTLRDKLSVSLFNQVLSELGITIDEFERRIKGINEEYEFLLGLYLSGICDTITLPDETYYKLFNSYTSDIMVTIGKRKVLIECKYTEEDFFKFSKGTLQRKVDYANNLGFGLYFAIKFSKIGQWMLVGHESIAKEKVLTTDFKKCEMGNVLGFRKYMVKGLEFISIFKDSQKNTLGIQYPPYGYLSSEELKVNGKSFYKIKKKDDDMHGYLFLTQGFKSVVIPSIINKDGITIVTEKLDSIMVSEFELILAPMKQIVKENLNKMSSIDHLNSFKQNKEGYLTRENIRSFISSMPNKCFILLSFQK